MFLYILLALAVLFILAQAWLIWIYTKRIDVLCRAYESLDQGMTEVTDAYETDSLQYESTIEKLNEQKEIDRIARHEQALTIDSYRARLTDERETKRHLIEENLGIRRQLDIAQVIISEHDKNCLPHIVLASMENHKDEPLPSL